jgi:hypothetical protein
MPVATVTASAAVVSACPSENTEYTEQKILEILINVTFLFLEFSAGSVFTQSQSSSCLYIYPYSNQYLSVPDSDPCISGTQSSICREVVIAILGRSVKPSTPFLPLSHPSPVPPMGPSRLPERSLWVLSDLSTVDPRAPGFCLIVSLISFARKLENWAARLTSSCAFPDARPDLGEYQPEWTSDTESCARSACLLITTTYESPFRFRSSRFDPDFIISSYSRGYTSPRISITRRSAQCLPRRTALSDSGIQSYYPIFRVGQAA